MELYSHPSAAQWRFSPGTRFTFKVLHVSSAINVSTVYSLCEDYFEAVLNASSVSNRLSGTSWSIPKGAMCATICPYSCVLRTMTSSCLVTDILLVSDLLLWRQLYPFFPYIVEVLSCYQKIHQVQLNVSCHRSIAESTTDLV